MTDTRPPAYPSRQVREIDTAIARARLRQQVYLSRGDTRSAYLESVIINRRLDERLEVTGTRR